MQGAVKKKTAMVATAAAVGFSSLFMATPANAAPITCSQGATLLAGNICELRVTTAGPSTFTPSAEMSQLEALLVAGGGNGVPDQGYGAASGGGGDVKVVGFGDTSTPMMVVVGGPGQFTSVTQGAVASYGAAPGSNGTPGSSSGPNSFGGASGNGKAGSASSGSGAASTGGAGGGAASAAIVNDGGAGVSVASLSPSGSLFSNVTDCYGGGGAIGTFGGIIGFADCNAGHVVSGAAEVIPVAPLPNSGGGATGSGPAGASPSLRQGGSGLVVLRWAVLDVTVTFASNGHGGSVASHTFPAGGTVTPPAAPTETGFTFNGWYSDAALTTPADFTSPVTAATTFYASWSAVVPVTVSFDSGQGSSIAPQSIVPGSTVPRPADPSLSGFSFNGWFSDAALTTPADFSAPVTASTTFYASWTAVVVPPITPIVPPVAPEEVPPVTPVVPPATTVAPSATPAPASVAPVASNADRVLATTGRAIDPSALSSGLAALGFGLALLAMKARRARKTN